MESYAQPQTKPLFRVSRLALPQIDVALELLAAQLKEHGIEAENRRIREVMEKVISDERRGFILAATDMNEKILGVAYCSSFLGLEHEGESGWLEELYVLPEWRQQGVGTGLVAEAIRIAKARGWRALDLEVEADHQRVVSLYARHGFQPHTRSRFYLKLG
jgi:ribosomal protein S18 acetylase RimI-like enzyme